MKLFTSSPLQFKHRLPRHPDPGNLLNLHQYRPSFITAVLFWRLEVSKHMNTRNQTIHILLALMLTVSIVVLSGHKYSHSRVDLASCQLCIHHGNSGNAITLEIDEVFFAPVLATLIQIHQPEPPANTDFYHQPSRAPPRFI